MIAVAMWEEAMRTFEQIVLVNYCHPDCVPMKNIMRLPKAEAFALARRMAEAHPGTTAFYRFADFENYYALRLAQDEYLHARFVELGGEPEETHPLSFVVESSDYLREWFGVGHETRLSLGEVSPSHISFTIGDSGSGYQRNPNLEVLTLSELKRRIDACGGDVEAFLRATGRGYVEAQLWSDRYLTEAVLRSTAFAG